MSLLGERCRAIVLSYVVAVDGPLFVHSLTVQMWDVTVATMSLFAAATATVQLVGMSVDQHMIATQQTSSSSIVVSLFRSSFWFSVLLFSQETLMAKWQHQRCAQPNQASRSNAEVRGVDSYSIRSKQHDSTY